MIHLLGNLFKFRELILTLVSRELKARYRGTVLGYFWSLLNPLLLLLIYTVVFSTIFQPRIAGIKPYAMFLFCGLLPWTWFSGSLLEATIVIPDNVQLVKRVLFPTEILVISKVISHGVHFFLALPILILALVTTSHLSPTSLLLPIPIFLQLLFTSGMTLIIASFSIHFKDLKDLMQNVVTLWFFATPIIYTLSMLDYPWLNTLIRINPATSLFLIYQDVTFHQSLPALQDLIIMTAISLVVFMLGALLFDRLREAVMEDA